MKTAAEWALTAKIRVTEGGPEGGMSVSLHFDEYRDADEWIQAIINDARFGMVPEAALRRRLEKDLDASTTELQAVRKERDRYLSLLRLIKGDLENRAPDLFKESKP